MLGNRLKIIPILFILALTGACEEPKARFVFDEVTLEYTANDENILDAFAATFFIEGTEEPFDGEATMVGALAPKMIWYFEKGKVKQVDSYNRKDQRLRSNVYEDGHTIASRTWYDTGELWVEWSKESGITKEYYINGQVKSEVPWSDEEIINGTVKYFDEDGTLLEQHEYVNGVVMKSEVIGEDTGEE